VYSNNILFFKILLILKKLFLITTLIILVTGVTVPSIDVSAESADKKSDDDKKKKAKAWLEEKYGNYKDYKKEQKENKKDAKEKREEYRKDAKEKREEYRDHKKEQKHDDDDDYKKEKDDDDYKKEKDDDYELGQEFKCKFTGAYFSPEDHPSGQSIVSIGLGECNAGFDSVISYGRLIVSDTLNDNDCYDVVSTSRSQSDTKGMKIFNFQGLTIYIEITGEQCFQNRNGDKVTPSGICGRGILLTSTVDGTFTITNDVKGSGTFTSTVTYWVDRLGVSYCDSEFPLGSLFESKFNGSIILS